MEDGNNRRLGKSNQSGLGSTQAVIEEQTRVQSVTYWSECVEPGCETTCPGARCESCKPRTSRVGRGIGERPQDIQTADLDIPDDLVTHETEQTTLLHRVDNLRIVRLDDTIGTEYRIEERKNGRWKKRTKLTREQLLLVSGLVNKRWGGE